MTTNTLEWPADWPGCEYEPNEYLGGPRPDCSRCYYWEVPKAIDGLRELIPLIRGPMDKKLAVVLAVSYAEEAAEEMGRIAQEELSDCAPPLSQFVAMVDLIELYARATYRGTGAAGPNRYKYELFKDCQRAFWSRELKEAERRLKDALDHRWRDL